MDGPKNVMQLRLRPAYDEKPIFCHDFFVIEVGAHHIYDDTGFCHNYRHKYDRKKNRSAQNVTDVSFFVV